MDDKTINLVGKYANHKRNAVMYELYIHLSLKKFYFFDRYRSSGINSLNLKHTEVKRFSYE